MEKINFNNVETTKEQYLKFKEFIKSNARKDHAVYVAYYIFKHRITGEERDKYLEEEVNTRCHKMLFNGRWHGMSGGDCTLTIAAPSFKNTVISVYNRYTDPHE